MIEENNVGGEAVNAINLLKDKKYSYVIIKRFHPIGFHIMMCEYIETTFANYKSCVNIMVGLELEKPKDYHRRIEAISRMLGPGLTASEESLNYAKRISGGITARIDDPLTEADLWIEKHALDIVNRIESRSSSSNSIMKCVW